eukprot:757991-Hanusia_phi.AAC.10
MVMAGDDKTGQILTAADIIKGKKCTAYPAVGPQCKAAGADFVEANPIDLAVTDGNLVTAAAWPDCLPAQDQRDWRVGQESQWTRVRGKLSLRTEGLARSWCSVETTWRTMRSWSRSKRSSQLRAQRRLRSSEGRGLRRLGLPSSRKQASVSLLQVIPGGRAPEYLALNDKVKRARQRWLVCEGLARSSSSFRPLPPPRSRSLRSAMANRSTCQPGQSQLNDILTARQILAAAGVLGGKKCTAYPAVGPACKLAGAEWVEANPIDLAVTDGHLVSCG